VLGTSSSKKNLCPVCGNHHGCKIQSDKWVLCLRGSSQQDAPSGYRFVKPLRNGMGGLWVALDGSDNWNEQEQSLWRQEQELKRSLRSEAQARLQAKLLSAKERDEQYRLVNQNLTLTERHRQTLGSRDLASSEIEFAFELGALRTWNPEQRVFGLSPDLAGLNPVTRTLASVYGIAIYALDPDGHITGAQVKPDNENLGKYLWLSSQRQGGNGPQLLNGELPLFVWKHPDAQSVAEVWLCEGALKSLIVALKLWRDGRTDVAVIGTASAARYGEQTLKAYLRQLGCQTLRLLPDAGAVGNPHISQANSDTLAACIEWGYSITVGWWGQVDKSHPDIDELKSFDAIAKRSPLWGIAFLTPDEFWEKHPSTLRPNLRDSRVDSHELSFPTITEDEWQLKFGLPAWFKQQIERFSEAIKRFRKPLLKSFQTKAKTAATTLKYISEKLPTPEEYRQLGSPVIRFAAGQRLEVIKELVALGYHDILDSSGTGTSKSYDAGLAEPESLDVDRLWYFSQDHRNPTTPTVEANYTDMPVRNNGMVVDGSRRTALNNPFVRWPAARETPTLPGNCFRTETFHALVNKGYQLEIGTEASLNPICQTCHVAANCMGRGDATPGPGHSFRSDRRYAFASSRLRASIDSAPNAADLEPKQDDESGLEKNPLGSQSPTEGDPPAALSHRNAAILDEAMRQLKPFNLVEAHLSDFDQVWAELESLRLDLHLQLQPLRLALRPILKGEVKPTKETYHGWSDTAIRQALGQIPEKIVDIINQLELIKPNFQSLLTEPDSFNKDGVAARDRQNVSNGTSKRVRDAVRQNSYREMLEKLQSLASFWLVPLLKVWGKLERGSFRIKHGVLSIMTHNPRHAEVLKAMKWVVYQDATALREYLGLYLGIDPTSIVQVEPSQAAYNNLQIVQVTGLGLVGHDRTGSLKARLEVLRLMLKQRHPDIAFIDYKEYALMFEGDGWWFNHNRGSNEYLSRGALASFGIPYQDIGSLQMIYITLTGDYSVSRESPGFSAFVQWQASAEIAQCVGRLRANRRPDDAVTYYSCADFELSFLHDYYPGATITSQAAFSIASSAGTATEQSHHHIQSAILELLQETGMALEKLTQVAAAAKAGVSQSRISQVATKYGGWKAYKKLLAVVFNSIYRGANNSDPLDEEQEFIAKTYLPLAASEPAPDAVQAVVDCFQVYGWRVFQAIVAATSVETRGRLLAALLSGLPQGLQEEFRAIAVDALL